MEKDYDVYKELVSQATTAATAAAIATSKSLMHERKPLNFSPESNVGDEADSSTWELI